MIYDLPNALFIVIIVYSAFLLKYIPSWLCFVLIIGAFFPYLFNGFIFPEYYMPDQYKYFHIAKSIRDFDFNYVQYSKNVELSSWMLTLFPLPIIETIYSLGFVNKFIYVILVIYLYHNKNVRGLPLYFIVFYPSLLMYTSLSLRDTLVLIFMLFSTIHFIKGQFFISAFFLILLSLIKFQNSLILSLFFLYCIIFNSNYFIYKFRFLIIFVSLSILLYFIDYIIPLFEFYRSAMYREDGGDMSIYKPISTAFEFFIMLISSFPYFLMKPFVWEVSSFLQLIQSIENIILLFVICIQLLNLFRFNNGVGLKWVVFLILSFSIYGLVVFNFGTAVRYKFPFLVLFFVCSYLDVLRHYETKKSVNYL